MSHGWERIAAEVFAGNDASVRVLEKLGLRPEGMLRGHWVRFGERRDTLVFGLLRDDR
jgi:RimJ/RimL family protein N-acetyltransferase